MFSERSYLGAVVTSLLLAMMLTVAPWPREWLAFQPRWVPLTVLMWMVIRPRHLGLLGVWVVGLLLDVLEGVPLGVNAAALVVLVAVASTMQQRLRMFNYLTQAMMIFVLTGIYQLVVYWMKNIYSMPQTGLAVLWGSLTSALLWPLLAMVLGAARRVLHHV